ncbi:MAG: hypothetical protein V4772_18675 [Pseudomonadota bacterium]
MLLTFIPCPIGLFGGRHGIYRVADAAGKGWMTAGAVEAAGAV